jgi:hypothetical protein
MFLDPLDFLDDTVEPLEAVFSRDAPTHLESRGFSSLSRAMLLPFAFRTISPHLLRMTTYRRPVRGRRIAKKAKATTGKIKAQTIAATGLTSRIRGHVSARGRRAQGRRDTQ